MKTQSTSRRTWGLKGLIKIADRLYQVTEEKQVTMTRGAQRHGRREAPFENDSSGHRLRAGVYIPLFLHVYTSAKWHMVATKQKVERKRAEKGRGQREKKNSDGRVKEEGEEEEGAY